MRPALVRDMARDAALRFGCCAGDIFSPSRLPTVVMARANVIRRLHEAGYSKSQIGRWIGRDRSTVHHHVERAA